MNKYVFIAMSDVHVNAVFSIFKENAIMIHATLNPIDLLKNKPNYIHYNSGSLLPIPVEDMEILLHEHNIEFNEIEDFIPLAELATLTCLRLKQKYSINFSDTEFEYNSKFLDKAVATKILNKHNVCPLTLPLADLKMSYLEITKLIGSTKFIIKPITGIASLDTFFISNEDQLHECFRQINQSKFENFIIQTYIQGDLYHCDFIQQDNEIKFFGLGKYSAPLLEFKNKNILYSLILDINNPMYNLIKEFGLKVLKLLSTQDGIFHMEVFLNHYDNKLYFLECANRLAGDGVSILYNTDYQINLHELDVKVRTGTKIEKVILNKHIESTIVGCPLRDGTIVKYNIPTSLSSSVQIIKQIPEHTKVKKGEKFSDLSLAFMLLNNSNDALKKDLDILNEHLIVEYAAEL